jgi:CheY-like chemotaxis protein
MALLPPVVLVVEDDDQVRDYAIEVLREAGFAVLSARDAEEALQLLENDGAIEVLFTDVVMPGAIDGFELARRARETHPRLAVVYATGFAEAVDRLPPARAVDRLLRKPYSPDELQSEVGRAIGQKQD